MTIEAPALAHKSLADARDKFAAAEGRPLYCLRYHLAGNPGATTPEPAEGAMHDRGVLIGLGATNIEVVEVKP